MDQKRGRGRILAIGKKSTKSITSPNFILGLSNKLTDKEKTMKNKGNILLTRATHPCPRRTPDPWDHDGIRGAGYYLDSYRRLRMLLSNLLSWGGRLP